MHCNCEDLAQSDGEVMAPSDDEVIPPSKDEVMAPSDEEVIPPLDAEEVIPPSDAEEIMEVKSPPEQNGSKEVGQSHKTFNIKRVYFDHINQHHLGNYLKP